MPTTNNPYRMGELYTMKDPDDQAVLDELKRKIDYAVQLLDSRITALDSRVEACEDELGINQ